MTDKKLSRPQRILNSVKGHLRAAMIALIFGMTAYGIIYMLYLIINYVKKS